MENLFGKQSEENSFGDQDLWEEVRMGNRDAFAMIYKRYFQDLFRYGMTILPNREPVGDAIQELFIDLWAYRNNLTNIKQLKFYLLRSLRSKIYRNITNKNRIDIGGSEYLKDGIQFLPSHEEHIIDRDQDSSDTQRVITLINHLPELQREAIMLIFFEQKTYEEAAQVMSKKIQSVYTLVHRAVSTLRKEMS